MMIMFFTNTNHFIWDIQIHGYNFSHNNIYINNKYDSKINPGSRYKESYRGTVHRLP